MNLKTTYTITLESLTIQVYYLHSAILLKKAKKPETAVQGFILFHFDTVHVIFPYKHAPLNTYTALH